MATRMSSPPRKHRSSDKDRKDTRKKKKESISSRKDKFKHSKKSSGLKVRTVSELATLVSSGAVKVPQGLEHYMSDRQQLLDQVFTILSPDDVSMMVPNALKGLKMKRVKALCLTQLQSMSEQELLAIIQPTDTSSESEPSQTNAVPSSSSQPVETEEVSGNSSCTENKETDIAVSDISNDEEYHTKDNPTNIYNSTPDAITLSATDLPNSRTDQIHNEVNADATESKSTDISQLLEMDLRQRALESALKRATDHNDNATQDQEDMDSQILENNTSSTTAHTTIMEDEREDRLENEGLASDYIRAAGELVEQRLREKLLLSLAAKRHQV